MHKKENNDTLSIQYDILGARKNSSKISLLKRLLNVSNYSVIDFSLCDFEEPIDLYWVIKELNKRGRDIAGIEIIARRDDENFKHPQDIYIENLSSESE